MLCNRNSLEATLLSCVSVPLLHPLQGCLGSSSATSMSTMTYLTYDVRAVEGLTFPKQVEDNVHDNGSVVPPPGFGNALEISNTRLSISAFHFARCFTILCIRPIYHDASSMFLAQRPLSRSSFTFSSSRSHVVVDLIPDPVTTSCSHESLPRVEQETRALPGHPYHEDAKLRAVAYLFSDILQENSHEPPPQPCRQHTRNASLLPK